MLSRAEKRRHQILSHPSADWAPQLAEHLAFKTEVSPRAVFKIIKISGARPDPVWGSMVREALRARRDAHSQIEQRKDQARVH